MENTTLQERLQTLRKGKGYSQEQLADLVGVSRQAVSKWESGASLPDIDNLVRLSELYGESLDGIVKGKSEQAQEANTVIQLDPLTSRRLMLGMRSWHYEYKSEATLWGMPLVHVNLGRKNGRLAVAKGVVAVGTISVGLLSVGIFSLGLLSIGILGLGLITLATCALGLLVAAGCLAVGTFAMGIVPFGYFALGVSAIGVYAGGVTAVANKVAVGVVASADVAIAAAREGSDAVNGLHTMLASSNITVEQAAEFIKLYAPQTPRFIIDTLAKLSTIL